MIESSQLSLSQLFNCDETGLYWRLLPRKTLAGGYENAAHDFKKPKYRVTILATANASGDFRLPLLLIGKSQNPRCLKHINHHTLPVVYKSQKKAWMNSLIFRSWFFDHFIPKVTTYLRGKGLPVKAFLLLDNAPSHPASDLLHSPDGNIKCIFLSANTTSLIQPMDQGVLENLKRRYTHALLQRLLLSQENESRQQFVKDLNIKDCIYMCAKAWEDIRSESLSRAWNKLLMSSTAETQPESTDTIQPLLDIGSELALSSDEVQEWLASDRDMDAELTDEEVIQMARDEDTDDSPQDSPSENTNTCITHSAATAAFDVCIQYMHGGTD